MSTRINFYRSPVDRDLLRSLTERSDAWGLAQSLGTLGVYLATTLAAVIFFRLRLWLPMVLACYLHSALWSLLGTGAVHELSHGTPFRTKWLNEFFYSLFSFLAWANPVHFRESHRRHHQFTVHEGLDKEVILEPAPFNTWDVLTWFVFDWKLFRMFMRSNIAFVLGRDMPDPFAWDPLFERDDPKRAAMFRFARVQLLLHLALVVVFVYFELYVLIFTVTFSYFCVTFLTRTCVNMQHTGLMPDVPDWRLTCHTVKFGRFMAFLYWNMNYHIEHHSYAAVPSPNLQRLHEAIAGDCPTPEVGYLRGVKKIMRLVRSQRRDPDWCYLPDLPEGAAPPRLKQVDVSRRQASD
jgi:fatty acid desaturase